MTKQMNWAIAKLEKGEPATCLFNAKVLDMMRLYFEQNYRSWPIEVRVKEQMMTLTPVEPFVKREI